MNITNASEKDLPGMINLLKLSLGESLTPKTEGYFVWKHHLNPFGKSKVLLAKEEDRIIGLRAFMHWTWTMGKEQVSAVRAVDTATDPAFQGKGIFKKLTLQAVEECRQENVKMVFNSPNPISMQGYLKMGWSLAGRLPVYLGPGSIFPARYSEKAIEEKLEIFSAEKGISKLKNHRLVLPAAETSLHTDINYEYLHWRYQTCPIVTYGASIVPGEYGFIFRLKKLNRFLEMRICDAWTENGASGSKSAGRALKQMIKQFKPALVSSSSTPLFNNSRKHLPGLIGPFKKGPTITVRPLVLENLDQFLHFNKWEPSLGSMELF